MALIKDKQISMRFNSEVLEKIKEAASAEHLSVPDYLTKLFLERDKFENRLEALERVVFQKSA
ncbi:hypothetical protein [Nostoc linckia]|nr:hypothetical protein [Nostoc linckia]